MPDKVRITLARGNLKELRTLRNKLPDTEDPFDALLAWLDPDRDIAAQRLLTIRAGLSRVFISRGCDVEPAAYFHGVARYVIMEKCRPSKEIATDQVQVAATKVTIRSDEYECLLRCLEFMDPAKRELILDYHVYQGRDKIEQHEIMAQELGISEGALRGRAHHIRIKLEECVLKCIESLNTRKQKPPPEA
jgi:hypothetical protein